jgi:hypothetical protein
LEGKTCGNRWAAGEGDIRKAVQLLFALCIVFVFVHLVLLVTIL